MRHPVWKGFGASVFKPSINPQTSKPYTYGSDGFEATAYELSTHQLGTQLDPPAHWAPGYPAIDELPATYAVRPLVVISIADKVARDPKYALSSADVRAFERRHGHIPAGLVVMIRSDWSRRWSDDQAKAKALAADPDFPGVPLGALKLLRAHPAARSRAA
jgi:kynurenine formamidase